MSVHRGSPRRRSRHRALRKGDVVLCGTCMDARGLREDEVVEGARRSTLAQLADWPIEADKVLVF